MTIFKTLLFIIPAYMVGSIPTGVIVSRFMGKKDPRGVGSGNIGATNVLRSAGKKAGLIVLAGDMGKGAVPVLLSLRFGVSDAVTCLVALSVFLGHLYPVFLSFKGGKGVATAAGIYLVLSPASLLAGLIIFAIAVIKTGYVSLGSITAGILMPLIIGLFTGLRSYILLAAVLGLMILCRHRENVKRILDGSENKVFHKS